MKHLFDTSCKLVIIVVSGLLCHAPIWAQCDNMQPMQTPSSSVLTTDVECHVSGCAHVSGLTGSVASSWSPATNGYRITPVGAECAGGINETDDYMATIGGPRRVSPNGGLGEPGAATPIGDMPTGMLLLFVGIYVIHCARKKKEEKNMH